MPTESRITEAASAIAEILNRLPYKCTISGYLATGGALELAKVAIRASIGRDDTGSPKHNDRIDVGGALVEAYRKEVIQNIKLEREITHLRTELETRASAYASTIEESARIINVLKAQITGLETELDAFHAAEELG